MSDTFEFIGFVATMLFGGAVLLAAVAGNVAHSRAVDRNTVLRQQAVERGFAEYCIPNGNWAWKGECPTTPTREKEE